MTYNAGEGFRVSTIEVTLLKRAEAFVPLGVVPIP